MISILVVSHSRALARAALELASEMVAGPRAPRVALAAGLDDGSLGTDASAIAAALAELDGPDGTLVLMDLGSALLSAEMALDFLDPAVAGRVRLSPAPLVEGLVTAVVTAACGAGLDEVDAQARASLGSKGSQLDEASTIHPDVPPSTPGGRPLRCGPALDLAIELADPHGLHARPAAQLVAALAGLDATVQVGRTTGDLVDARSLTALAGLCLGHGEALHAHLEGPDAIEAARRIEAVAGSPTAPAEPLPTQPSRQPGERDEQPGRELARHRLVLEPECGSYRAGDDERARLQAAMGRADDFLLELAEGADPASTEATVLGAVRTMLHDPQVIKGFHRQLDEGHDALQAVQSTMSSAAARFEAMPNAYFRERAVDLRALGRLVVSALLEADLHLPELPAGHALEVDELDAVVAAQLDARRTPAVVVRTPGESGHGVMVARSRGIQVAVSPG